VCHLTLATASDQGAQQGLTAHDVSVGHQRHADGEGARAMGQGQPQLHAPTASSPQQAKGNQHYRLPEERVHTGQVYMQHPAAFKHRQARQVAGFTCNRRVLVAGGALAPCP
jgi:hypothetical protein